MMFLESAIGYGERDRQQYTLPVRFPLHRPEDAPEFPNLAISAAGFLKLTLSRVTHNPTIRPRGWGWTQDGPGRRKLVARYTGDHHRCSQQLRSETSYRTNNQQAENYGDAEWQTKAR